MYTLNSKIQPYTTKVPLVLRVLFIHFGIPASKNEKYSSYRLFLLKHLPGLDFFWDLSGFTLLLLTQIWQSVAKPIPFLNQINLGVIGLIQDTGCGFGGIYQGYKRVIGFSNDRPCTYKQTN